MGDEAPKVSSHNAVPSCTFSTVELKQVSGCEAWVFGEMLTSCLMYCAMSWFIVSRKADGVDEISCLFNVELGHGFLCC